MTNEKFWNECYQGSLREKIASFIDKSPLLNHFRGDKYYQLEDDIVKFIRENADMIHQEVEKEWDRDDTYGIAIAGEANAPSIVFSALPIEVIDRMIDDWKDFLACDNEVADLKDFHIRSALDFLGIFENLDEYSEDDLYAYAAYVQEWYFNHNREYNQSPASIKEFFDCEFKEKQGRYKNLALVFKKRFSKC